MNADDSSSPGRRSVELKAATASSRAEERYRCFVRQPSVPALAERSRSVGARSDSTTKVDPPSRRQARASTGPDDGHEPSSGSKPGAREPAFPDVAADEIETRDRLRRRLPEPHCRGRRTRFAPKSRGLLTIGGASSADDVGPPPIVRSWRHHRPHCAGPRRVPMDALPCPKAAVLEQSLPRSQAPRSGRARAHRGSRRPPAEARGLRAFDGRVLGQGWPVRDTSP